MAIKFESTTQLMQNAFPAGSLQPRKDFCVVEDKDGEHMIFLVDNKTGHLSLVLKGTNGQNELIDLSRSFGIAQQNSIRSFAVSQNADGTIHLVFAVQRPGTWDELYVVKPMTPELSAWSDAAALRNSLYKPMQTDNSGSISVKDGLYVDDNLNVEIDRIILGTSNDYLPLKNKLSKSISPEALAYPQAYLVVKSSDRLTKDIWTVSINAVEGKWARRVGVTMPVNAHDIVDMTVANLGTSGRRSLRGLFVLFRETSASQSVQLRFIGINVAENKAYPTLIDQQLPVPPDACSLSTFDNQNGTTDLLIGARTLHWLPVETSRNPNEGDETTSIDIGRDLASTEQMVITQTTSGKGQSSLSLWTLDKKGLLSYQEFSVGSVSEAPTPRTTPIPLLTQSSHSKCFSALKNTDQGQKLFVVGQDERSQKPVMKLLEQACQTGLWQSPLDILMPESTEVIEFLSYTTLVHVTTTSGAPAVHEKVNISCSSAAELLINGVTVRGSSSGTVVETDDTGTLTVITRTDGLSAPIVTLKGVDASSKLFPSTPYIIDPTKLAWEPFAQVKTGADLKNIKNQDGTPFISNSIGGQDLDKAAEALKQLSDIRKELQNPSGPVSLQITQDSAHPQWGMWYWVKQQLKSGFEWFLERVKEGWKFVVKISGQAWDWLLTNLPQAAEALQQILQVISSGWDSISKLLQKALGWDEILRVKNVFSNLTTQAILWVSDGSASANDQAAEFFQDMRDKVKLFKALRKDLPVQLKGKTIQDVAKTTSESELQKVLKGPDAQFGAYHLKNSSVANTTSLDGTDKAVLDRILARFGEVWEELKLLGTKFATNLQQVLSKGDFTIDAFIDNIGLDLLENGLAVLEKLVNAFLMTLSDLMLLLADSLNRPFNIPVLSPLYSRLTNGGTLSLLDAVCLVIAIPTTIAFRFLTGQNPTEDPAVRQWTQTDAFRAQLDQRMGRLRSQPSTASNNTIASSVMLQPMTPQDLNRRPPTNGLSNSVATKPVAAQTSQATEPDIHDFALQLFGQVLFNDKSTFTAKSQFLKKLVKGVMECVEIIKIAIPIVAMGYWSAVTFPKVSLQIKDPLPTPSGAFKAFCLHLLKLGSLMADPIKLLFALRKAKQSSATDVKDLDALQDFEGYKEKLKIRLQIWVVGFLPAVGRLGGDYGLHASQLVTSCIQAAFLTRLHVRFLIADQYSADRAWEEWFKLIGGASLAVVGLVSLQDYGASIAISFLAMQSANYLELERMDDQVKKIDWAGIPKRNLDAVTQQPKWVITLDETMLARDPSCI